MSKKVLFKGKKIENLQLSILKWSQKCSQCSKLFPSKFCLDRHLQIHQEDGKKTKKYECITCKKRFQEIANYLRHCMFHDRNKIQSKPSGTRTDSSCSENVNGNHEHFETDLEKSSMDPTETNLHPSEQSNGYLEECLFKNNPSHKRAIKNEYDSTEEDSGLANEDIEQPESDHNDLCENSIEVPYHPTQVKNGNSVDLSFKEDMLHKVIITSEDHSMDESKTGGNFSCGHCPESYNDSSALCNHIASVHNQGYKCNVCGAALSTIEKYLNHKRGHEKKRFKCQFCPRTFSNKKSCTIHERVHTGEKPYQCNTCQRAFTQKSHLSDHVRTHSGERPFACNQCNLAFTTHSSRRRHQRVVHRIGEKETFPCEVCGAVLSTKYSITLHLKRHQTGVEKSSEKKYLCTVCNSFFASSSSLRKHLKRIHNNEGGNTLCTICNLSYYSEATLKQHLLRAHGFSAPSEKLESISCDECGALMQTKSGILIHKRRCHDKP